MFFKFIFQDQDTSIVGKKVSITNKTTRQQRQLTADSKIQKFDLSGIGLPDCADIPYETHILDAESFLTVDGKLIVSKYEQGELSNDFCVDL